MFLTSKLDPRDHGLERCGPAMERAMSELGVKQLDLFLIHWPGVRGKDVKHEENRRKRRESWEVMEAWYREGRVRAIGRCQTI